MIIHEINTSFGGKATLIETRHCSCHITTAKEGIFKGLSVMVHTSDFRFVSKWIYSNQISKKNRQRLHSIMSSYINENLEFGYCLGCVLQKIESTYTENGIISDFLNLLKCEGEECSNRREMHRGLEILQNGSEERVLGKMEELYQFSIVNVFNILKGKGFKVNGEVLDEEDNGLWAEAVGNYIFCLDFNKEHLKKISSEDIQIVGRQLLEENNNLRELVVQSLRVWSVIMYTRTGDTDDSIFCFLGDYGHEFEEMVDPSSYKLLTLEKIELMENDKEIIQVQTSEECEDDWMYSSSELDSELEEEEEEEE